MTGPAESHPVRRSTPERAARGDAEDRAQDASLAPLLRAAALGDEQAWRELVERYSHRVFAMARSRRVSEEVAEEVTQSVFATLAERLRSGDYSEQGRFEPWLFRITINRVRDEIRRTRRHAEPTDPASFSGHPGKEEAERGAAGSELIALREAMGRLNESDRDVIELRHHGGLSFRQIADVLEEPLGTVLARHHRALRKLKEILEQDRR